MNKASKLPIFAATLAFAASVAALPAVAQDASFWERGVEPTASTTLVKDVQAFMDNPYRAALDPDVMVEGHVKLDEPTVAGCFEAFQKAVPKDLGRAQTFSTSCMFTGETKPITNQTFTSAPGMGMDDRVTYGASYEAYQQTLEAQN